MAVTSKTLPILICDTPADFDTSWPENTFVYAVSTGFYYSVISGTVTQISLSAFGAPTASVAFNDQQATSFRIENRTSDPGAPTEGQIWLRTDL